MNRNTFSMFGGALPGELDKSFIEGVSWPIDRGSLAALLDIGLNPQQIAQYFSVTPAEVRRLLESTGTAATPMTET
jgi:hypothetical protein